MVIGYQPGAWTGWSNEGRLDGSEQASFCVGSWLLAMESNKYSGARIQNLNYNMMFQTPKSAFFYPVTQVVKLTPLPARESNR